jgi:hypothetical protein
MAGDRPIDPPSDPLDSFIEEAEARWDSAIIACDTRYGEDYRRSSYLVEVLIGSGFSPELLNDCIVDKSDTLIIRLAKRLYSEANSTKGYD